MIHVFRDTVTRAGTLPPAGHRADVTKTSKYSRFRANKKRRACKLFQLIRAKLPPKAGEGKMDELASNHPGDTPGAVRSS
jgi:hypothetical protein